MFRWTAAAEYRHVLVFGHGVLAADKLVAAESTGSTENLQIHAPMFISWTTCWTELKPLVGDKPVIRVQDFIFITTHITM
jgi:hypothetical protein